MQSFLAIQCTLISEVLHLPLLRSTSGGCLGRPRPVWALSKRLIEAPYGQWLHLQPLNGDNESLRAQSCQTDKKLGAAGRPHG